MKYQFFSQASFTKNPFFYTLDTNGILQTEFSSIWTTPTPDKKDLILKFNNLNLFEIIANFRMKS